MDRLVVAKAYLASFITMHVAIATCCKLYAKQKQPGCKKVRGQSEATMVISDQNL